MPSPGWRGAGATMVNAVFADRRGSPFERGELVDEARIVEDADAAGSELRARKPKAIQLSPCLTKRRSTVFDGFFIDE